LPLEIERQLSHWFEPAEHRDAFGADRCPIALWEMPDGDVFATIPDEGHGVKCGMHHAGASTSPETVNRAVSMGENAVARELLEEVMPGAGGRLLDARVCLYTNTPDRHFIVDWVGDRVLLVSPCSGHGFKFASAIGEIAAQLMTERRSWLDLTPFSVARFRQPSRQA
jgi:sarcosine oxidase